MSFSVTVTGNTPGGTVTFADAGTGFATVTLDAGGQATATTSTLAVGSHSITATYNGDGSNAPSTFTTLMVALVQPTTTTLAPLVDSVFGQTITFGATVAPGSATGTGSMPAPQPLPAETECRASDV
jgi:hypothetical protein